jgi:hypothetical protein
VMKDEDGDLSLGTHILYTPSCRRQGFCSANAESL